MTWSALRLCYAMGGDGESDTRIDLHNFAAFVRDPGACVSCFLLPLSGSCHIEMKVGQLQSWNDPLRL